MCHNIRSWKASFYQDDKKKWSDGLLTCCPFSVSFQIYKSAEPSVNVPHDSKNKASNEVDSKSQALLLAYADIKQIQKARSMLIFPAVTVETFEGKVYWFSVPDQYSVCNILTHFVHHNLLGKNNTGPKIQSKEPESQTQLGQQLIRCAEDSDKILAAAANELRGQGRQLDSANINLLEIHQDLDVAEHLLSGLDTYLCQWRLPKEYQKVEPIHISKSDILQDKGIEVLCSERSKNCWYPQLLCTLHITDSGLTLMTMHQKILYSLLWTELSRVFIVSPWEVVLSKHVAGQADIIISVVSAILLPVLQVLHKRVPHLVDYQTIPDQIVTKNTTEMQSITKITDTKDNTDGCQHLSSKSRNLQVSKQEQTEKSTTDLHLQLLQGKHQQEPVSKSELSTLHCKLGRLKSMATAVGEELTSQNQTLDNMISSVQIVDTRVRDATRRTKRLV